MKLEGLTILLVSNEPWGDVWFSKHHYALELAKRNKVIFLDPPSKWTWRTCFRPCFRLEAIFSGLSVVRYRNVLARAVAGPAFALNAWLVGRLLGAFLRRSDSTPDLVFTFDPFRPFPPATLGARREIYYVVDDYETSTERNVLRFADTLLAVSPELAVRKHDDRRRVAHVIPHGVPDHDLDEVALEQAPSGKEIIFCGTLGIRTDFEILLAVATHFPASVLRLVGPLHSTRLSGEDLARVAALRALPNVVFAGVKPYPEMSRYIAAATVGICAYKRPKSAAEASSVLKNIQYLSFGKPVVSTAANAYAGLDPGFVWLAGDQTEFIRALEKVLSAPHDPGLVRARIAFTKEFSYAKLVERIEKVLG